MASLIEAVYPSRCAGCDRRGTWLCADCDAALPRFAPPWCQRCGSPFDLTPCICQQLSGSLSHTRSLDRYDGWLRTAVHRFKYQDEWARAAPLAADLAVLLHSMLPVDALVPVPLHPERLRSRGYNQALLLAREAERLLRVPTIEALIRGRATPQQVGLPAAQRRTNVAGAFSLAQGMNVQGRTVVLIDDVLTTGATLGACAEALCAAGAIEVKAATLAR